MRPKSAVIFGLAAAALAAGSVAGLPAAAQSALQISTTPALYPTFTTSTHYYVVRCDGSNPVQVSVDAPSGTTVSVDGQPAQSGNFNTQVGNYGFGQEFLIKSSSDSQDYHVRCLPSDFPSWSSTQSAGQTQALFFATTPDVAISCGFGCADPPYVIVFDTNGVPRWWFKDNQNGLRPFDAKVLPNGDIVWIDSVLSGPNNPYAEHKLDGSVARTFPPSNAAGTHPTDFHELQVLPNGNYFLAMDESAQVNLTPCGGPSSGTVTDNVLQEISSTGQLLFWWSTANHIPTTEVGSQWHTQCLPNGAQPGDPYHFNGIQVDKDGNIIVSYRHLNALFKIQVTPNKPGNGQILWKLGGTPTPQSLAIKNDSRCPSPSNCSDFAGQHDPRLWTDSSGNTYVTLHDNGTNANRAPHALRFAIDTAARTATLKGFIYDANVTASSCCGSARKMPAGDWLVDWGFNPYVEEITPQNQIIFKLQFTNSGGNGPMFSYRADPVTATSTSYGAGYGNALNNGMNQQYPRSPGG